MKNPTGIKNIRVTLMRIPGESDDALNKRLDDQLSKRDIGDEVAYPFRDGCTVISDQFASAGAGQIITAPVGIGTPPPNRVHSVAARPGETVEWILDANGWPIGYTTGGA